MADDSRRSGYSWQASNWQDACGCSPSQGVTSGNQHALSTDCEAPPIMPTRPQTCKESTRVDDGGARPHAAADIDERLRAQGKTVEYFTYPDQGHALQGENWQLFMQRTADFFDIHLTDE